MVGDIVLAPFPFTDMTGAKIRPALVVADVGTARVPDWIVCQITSSTRTHVREIAIGLTDMQSGQLRPGSRIRPDRLMTLNETIFQGTIGHLTAAKQAEIAAAVRSLF